MVAVASLVEGQAALAGRRKEVEARGAGSRGFGRAPRTEFDDLLEDEKNGVGGSFNLCGGIRAQSKELALLNAKLKAATATLGKAKYRSLRVQRCLRNCYSFF